VSSRRPTPIDHGVLDRVFGVLADPTRRRLIDTLVQHGPHTATQLAADFTISRQAIVKHLRVMADAGMVAADREGRDVRYRATTECLAQAVSWLLQAGPAWDRRLDRLGTATERSR
jgi:DNA-binding transcriptional ArsR family regulator